MWDSSARLWSDEQFAPTVIDPANKGHVPLPDYLNDLNACHEMEKVLTKEQHFTYIQAVYRIVVANSAFIAMVQGEETTGFYIMHATAAQRCEAFLKTLGLWEQGGEG